MNVAIKVRYEFTNRISHFLGKRCTSVLTAQCSRSESAGTYLRRSYVLKLRCLGWPGPCYEVAIARAQEHR